MDNARVLFKRKWLEEGRKRGFRKNKHLGGGGAAFSGITKEETLSCKSQGSITAQRRPTQNEGKWWIFILLCASLLSSLELSFPSVPDVLDKLFSQVYQLPIGQGNKHIKMVLGPTRPRRPVYPGIEPFRDNAGREYQLTHTVRSRNLVLR